MIRDRIEALVRELRTLADHEQQGLDHYMAHAPVVNCDAVVAGIQERIAIADRLSQILADEEGGWRPFSERPDAMNMPGRQVIFVEGWKEHSGTIWHRCGWGVVGADATGPHGYSRRSIGALMESLDMDGIDRVTHWMPAVLPPPPGARP